MADLIGIIVGDAAVPVSALPPRQIIHRGIDLDCPASG
jgi:hypothetical protein